MRLCALRFLLVFIVWGLIKSTLCKSQCLPKFTPQVAVVIAAREHFLSQGPTCEVVNYFRNYLRMFWKRAKCSMLRRAVWLGWEFRMQGSIRHFPLPQHSPLILIASSLLSCHSFQLMVHHGAFQRCWICTCWLIEQLMSPQHQ